MLERHMANGPASPTPKEVLLGLVKAFGAEKVGETGYDLAATRTAFGKSQRSIKTMERH